MHAGAVVVEHRLGHEGRGLAVGAGDVADDVLVPLKVVRRFDERAELEVDLVLGRGDFVVMAFNLNAELLHHHHHLHAQIAVGVERRGREVAELRHGLVAEVRMLVCSGVPRALFRVNRVKAAFCIVRVLHVIENEELGFWAKEGRVANPGGGKVLFRFPSDAARVAAVALARDRIHDVADQRERGLGEEGVHFCGGEVRDHLHVAGVNRLPAADAGAVEHAPVFQHVLAKVGHGEHDVLPGAEEVNELEVHRDHLVVLG